MIFLLSMAKKSHFARRPQPIREQVTRRLQEGGEGKQNVEWLRALPEAQNVMAAAFDGQPIHENN
jgi:hypothetical protein